MDWKDSKIEYRLEIETITPVHIGNGEEYINGLDFYNDTFINIDKISKHLMNDTLLFNEFLKSIEYKTLDQFFQAHSTKIPGKYLTIEEIPRGVTSTINGKTTKNNIKKHIQNDRGLYIPGSSLKGAFKTAIIKYIIDNNKRVQNLLEQELKTLENGLPLKPTAKPFQKIDKKMFGYDPKENLMRILQISDSTEVKKSIFKSSKVYGTSKNLINYYELIPDGKKLLSKISIDKYFYDKSLRDKAKMPQMMFDFFEFDKEEDDRESRYHFMNALNSLTEDILNANDKYLKDMSLNSQEQEYLSACNDELFSCLNDLEDNQAMINIGAGGGWLSNTGDLIGNQMSEKLRKNLKLAPNHLKFPFPKTRRLIWDGKDVFMPGWVKISFLEA